MSTDSHSGSIAQVSDEDYARLCEFTGSLERFFWQFTRRHRLCFDERLPPLVSRLGTLAEEFHNRGKVPFLTVPPEPEPEALQPLPGGLVSAQVDLVD